MGEYNSFARLFNSYQDYSYLLKKNVETKCLKSSKRA